MLFRSELLSYLTNSKKTDCQGGQRGDGVSRHNQSGPVERSHQGDGWHTSNATGCGSTQGVQGDERRGSWLSQPSNNISQVSLGNHWGFIGGDWIGKGEGGFLSH